MWGRATQRWRGLITQKSRLVINLLIQRVHLFHLFCVTFPWLALFHAVHDTTLSVIKSKVIFASALGRNIFSFARDIKNGAYLLVKPLEI